MKNETLHELGQGLSQIRDNKGLTQEELEELSGISVNSISKIENGETNPSYTTLLAFAKGFNMDLYQLFAQIQYEPIIKHPELQKIVDLLNSQDHKLLICALSQIEALVSYKNKA